MNWCALALVSIAVTLVLLVFLLLQISRWRQDVKAEREHMRTTFEEALMPSARQERYPMPPSRRKKKE